jgi:membrane-associated phospholipid phosphatase
VEATQGIEARRSAQARNARAAARASRRRPVGIVVAVVLASIAAFVPLAVEAWQKDAFAWDTDVSEWIHAYENEETVFDTYADPFSLVLDRWLQLLGALVVAVVVGALLRRRRWRAALFVALGVGGMVVLGPVLKELIARPSIDPPGEGVFPSGHALRSVAAAGALAVVAWPTRWRWPTVLTGALVVVLTGIAVVYHEWHWASDVLGAWLLATAWLGALWLALRPAA